VAVLAVSLAMLMPARCDGPTPPQPPVPDSTTVRVLTYNMRGMLRNADGADQVDTDRWRLVDVLAERIVAERPQIVPLQEICGSHADDLEALLSGRHPMTLPIVVDDGRRERCPQPRSKQGDKGHRGFGKAIPVTGSGVPLSPAPTGRPTGSGAYGGRVSWASKPASYTSHRSRRRESGGRSRPGSPRCPDR
jgi:hypothetical protein